jgi:transmembrane sensor
MSFPHDTPDPQEAASDWCIKLMTDKLTPAEHEAFLTWCDEDEENRVAFDDAVRAWQAFDPVSSQPAMIDMRSDALRDFRKAQAARHALPFDRRAMVAIAAAASVILAIGAGVWLGTRTQSYTTQTAERRIVALKDGSQVSLDGDTLVRVRFERGRRELWIERGRARFDVAKDPLRPFSVTAGDKVVVATGTQFSVERLSGELRVVLYEGHVNVLRATPAGDMQALKVSRQSADGSLDAGEQLIASGDGAIISPVDTRGAGAWEAGQLVFDNDALATAIARVNRHTDTPIRLGRLPQKPVRVSGVYKAGDVNAFLDGVSTVSGLQYRPEKDGFVLEDRAN